MDVMGKGRGKWRGFEMRGVGLVYSWGDAE